MTKTVGFAVRRHILKKALKDPAWKHEIEKAKTTWDLCAVLIEFCIEKGYKVASVR